MDPTLFMAGVGIGLLLTGGWLLYATARMDHDAWTFVLNDMTLRRLFT